MATDLYYQYEPLKHRFIRILRILPPATVPENGKHIGDVNVALEHEPLDQCRYIALSYTWGPSTLEEQDDDESQIFTRVRRCYPVYCGETIILVTRSLRDALKRVFQTLWYWAKHGAKRLQTDFVWADGICINQSDVRERSVQVRLMADIYSHANATIAYIGEPDEHGSRTRRAFDVAVKLGKINQKWKGDFMTTSSGIDDIDMVCSTLGIQTPSYEDFLEWAILMSREWFFRTWIIQESVLSGKTNVYILCGAICTQDESLVMATNLMSVSQWGTFLWQEWETMRELTQRYNRYESRIKVWIHGVHPYQWIVKAKQRPTKSSFYAMSHWQLPHTFCVDPRDKVYSTLGVAAEWQDLDDRLLVVSYDLNVSEVFCMATKYVIMKSKQLDILGTVLRDLTDPTEHDLPSWCPNYSRVAVGHRRCNLMDFPGDAVTLWSASGPSQAMKSQQRNPMPLLTLTGNMCDTIETIHSLDGDIRPPLACPAVLEFILREIMSSCGHTSKVDSVARVITLYGRVKTMSKTDWQLSLQDGLAKSMTHCALITVVHTATRSGVRDSTLQSTSANRFEDLGRLASLVEQIKDIEPSSSIHLPLDTLLREVSKERETYYDVLPSSTNAEHLEMSSSMIGVLDKLCSDRDEFARCQNVLLNMGRVCQGQALCSTKNGLIGLCSDSAQVKDQVWLLSGAKVPFVLRPTSNGHMELVGEAYVDGMMFGELWPFKEEALCEVTLV